MDARGFLLPAAMASVVAITGGWLLLSSAPTAAPPGAAPAPRPVRASDAQRLALQAQADAACRCARGVYDDDRRAECWAEFERSLARFIHSESHSLCMEESTSEICFDGPVQDGPGSRCIFQMRMYGACSAEEAEEQRRQAEARGDSGCG